MKKSLTHMNNEIKNNIEDFVYNIVDKYTAKHDIDKNLIKIKFELCPTHPTSSCTVYDHDNYKKDGFDIYLNPFQFSIRTVYHELSHVKCKLHADICDVDNEDEMNDIALQEIKEIYPSVIPKYKKNTIINYSTEFNDSEPCFVRKDIKKDSNLRLFD